MKSLLSKSITAASLLGLTACGVGADLGPLTAFEAQKSIAPTNQAQAESEIGIYGLAEAELASALATHPSLQYREVNKAQGL